MAVAAFASSPKLALWPDAAYVTREAAAMHSAAGTPNRCAAASNSISFAAAPAMHIPKPVPRTAIEPPVACVPNQAARRYAP